MLVTAGPTIEDIDPVRFISNRSTGRLGVEIARAALKRGWNVILVHGPLRSDVEADLHRSLSRKAPRIKIVPIRSAEQMHQAVMKHVRQTDAVVMNAAVADFAPVEHSPTKLKKAMSQLWLKLKPTVDILAAMGAWKKKTGADVILCGFALETGKGRTEAERRAARISEARRKLRDKNLDMIVLDMPQAMGADRCDFTLLSPDGALELKGCSKVALAARLVDHIRSLMQHHA
ncbi:MAG TPA: phosphopantothenoylcysteine decarboxylase [Planctomycetota bacterium]|nr:phosphopantothenoylcysteine decarboxylase [Planctomycetota bacterium]